MENAEREAIVREVRRVHKLWPRFLSDSTPAAEKAALALESLERRDAFRHAADFVKLCRHRKEPVCSFSVYLAERRWLKLSDLSAEERRLMAAEAQPKAEAGAQRKFGVYGREWGAARMLALLAGPSDFLPADLRRRVATVHDWRMGRGTAEAYRAELGLMLSPSGVLVFPEDFEQREWQRRVADEGYPAVNAMHEAARQATHAVLDADLERLGPLMEFVPLHGGAWFDWEVHHRDRRWPWLPEPRGMTGAYFPAGGHRALDDFERAARSILATRVSDDAA